MSVKSTILSGGLGATSTRDLLGAPGRFLNLSTTEEISLKSTLPCGEAALFPPTVSPHLLSVTGNGSE